MSPNLESPVQTQMAVAVHDYTLSSEYHSNRSEGKPVGRRRHVFAQADTGCVLGIGLDEEDNVHTVKRKLQLAVNLPTGENSLAIGDLSVIFNDPSPLLRQKFIYRSLSTPCLFPTGRDLQQRDQSGPIEILCCSSNYTHIKQLVGDVAKAIKSGVEPIKVHHGLGGAYYFRNSRGDNVAIVKPADEEPFAPNNPKGFVGKSMGQPGLKRSVRVGETGFREVAAYLLDYDHFASVPPTALVRITHSAFNINDHDNSKIQERKQQGVCKIASFQRYPAPVSSSLTCASAAPPLERRSGDALRAPCSVCGGGSVGRRIRVLSAERCGMLVAALMRLLSLCWSPVDASNGGSGDDDGGAGRERIDGLLRYRDIGQYAFGDFSMAVVQGNQVLEDQCRIESGPFGAFVGVYDGHGGPEAARYACDHLHSNFREVSSGPVGVTPESIERAFLQTEEGFTALVSELWDSHPEIATQGSCCLVGIICHQTLYVANLGDSRVVLGKRVGNTGEIAAIQLSTEHNVNVEAARQELKAQHPNDPQIVMLKHGVWRVKGIIQVSRSLGDAYMKHAEYNREPINPKFRISGAMGMPILSSRPAVLSHPLQKNDSFLIFASDGLWEHLSNEKAVDIIHNHPRVGSARRLVKAALQEAARKREMRYSDLRRIDRKVRRHFHDDITVIVLFLNHSLIASGLVQGPPLSIRSALEH